MMLFSLTVVFLFFAVPAGAQTCRDLGRGLVDQGCTEDFPICVQRNGGVVANGSTGRRCALCINSQFPTNAGQVAPDEGCDKQYPVCVGTRQLAANVEGTACAVCFNSISSTQSPNNIDDGCPPQAPICVNDVGASPAIWKPGTNCVAQCVDTSVTGADRGCPRRFPYCVLEDGSDPSIGVPGIKCSICSPATCDDNDPTTQDFCDPESGCYHIYVPVPTFFPTSAPTRSPTSAPTRSPTSAPTRSPTNAPTHSPTSAPTKAPTATPATSAPVVIEPTTAAPIPFREPTISPSEAPIEPATLPPSEAPIEPDQCEGSNICSAEHELLTAFLSDENFQFECNLCGDQLTLLSRCDGCSDEADLCVDRTLSFFITDFKNGTYEMTKTQGTASASGEDSASNYAVWESFLSFTFDTSWFDDIPGNSEVVVQLQGNKFSLDGVACDSFIFDAESCITVDCRNINSEFYWDCNDSLEILDVTNYFLHGFFAGVRYCPNEVVAPAMETMMAAAVRSPNLLPESIGTSDTVLFPELSLFPFKSI